MRVLLFVGVLAAPAGAVQKVLGSSLTEPSAFSSLEITANSTGACSGPNCGCPHACSGHGSCSNGVCQCFPGFTYYDCSLRTAARLEDCRERKDQHPFLRRKCHRFGKLTDPLRSFSLVSLPCSGVCPSDCSNNGFCYNATCHCHPGWRGLDCSVRSCPNECNYHGACKAGKCVCRPGWKGEDCAIRACPNDCSGHGTCTRPIRIDLPDPHPHRDTSLRERLCRRCP